MYLNYSTFLHFIAWKFLTLGSMLLFAKRALIVCLIYYV